MSTLMSSCEIEQQPTTASRCFLHNLTPLLGRLGNQWPMILLAIIFAASTIYVSPLLYEHIAGSITSSILAFGIAAFSVQYGKMRMGWVFVALALGFGYVAYALSQVTSFYLAWVSVAVIVLGGLRLRMGVVGLAAAFLSSGFFEVLFRIFGMEIKQGLTAVVGDILQYYGVISRAEGINMYYPDGSLMAVDTACMGLNMLKTSLLFSLLLLLAMQKKHGGEYGLGKVALVLSAALGLNILSNTIRIAVLVFTRQGEAGFWHEAIGLACFGLYTLPPLFILVRFLGKPLVSSSGEGASKGLLLPILATLSIVLLFDHIKSYVQEIKMPTLNGEFAHYKASQPYKDVLMLSDSSTVIYLKAAYHTPTGCWKGSGFECQQLESAMAGKESVSLGKMTKGEEVVYSAWWYQIGDSREQGIWGSLVKQLWYGQKAVLVNINGHSKEDVLKKAALFLMDN